MNEHIAHMLEMVMCIDCKNLDLQTKPEMSKHGFGLCKKGDAFRFQSVCAKRECAKFAKAEEQTLQKRKEWARKKGFRID
jgi:hypothetical protein